MPACINVAVVADDQYSVFAQVQCGYDLTQVIIGAFGCLIPGYGEWAAFMVAGVIYLVKMDEYELGFIVLQPGQSSLHYVFIGSFVLSWGVEAQVYICLRHQLFEPVITGNGCFKSGIVHSREQVVLRPGHVIFII
ncbi:hypothetical protein SDC9_145446 [bioreactor metagenome]|uniref:Uncharacterized protein n=1 Tax=bioreactor metagenome TaxID=1076179 RepID=A0A645EA11_9ZZZZ